MTEASHIARAEQIGNEQLDSRRSLPTPPKWLTKIVLGAAVLTDVAQMAVPPMADAGPKAAYTVAAPTKIDETKETAKATSTSVHRHYYDTSMFDGWKYNITKGGCGMTAASDAISYVLQKFVNPNQIEVNSHPWYNNGSQTNAADGHYMTGLGPQLARHYRVGYTKESLEAAAYDVTVNHAAAIILAVAGPHNTFTFASHYMALERSVGQRMQVADPDQPGHGQDGKLWGVKQLEQNGVFDEAWVFFPKGEGVETPNISSTGKMAVKYSMHS